MNERQIFEGALQFARWEDRRAFLDKACAGNPALRQSVDELLAAHVSSSEFLDAATIHQLQGQQKPKPDQQTTFEDSVSEPPDDLEDFSFDSMPKLEPATSVGAIGRLGHYEVLQVVGSGAFGVVFRAFDEKLHRQVAIKTLNVQLSAISPPRKRFLREARAVAAIKHENIVQIYGVEEDPCPYLVMEFVQGQTLQQKLDGSGPLEIGEILHLSRQMAAGLAAAHAQGLIHRDIKPGNILLEQGVEQKVKITDFGLARAADDASITRSGVISGTPLYMSPEQAMGLSLDERSDLFSLGTVMYQMASGRAAFRAPNTVSVLRRVVDDTPRDMQEVIPELPSWLVTIVSKLMEKKPDARYQTAKEVSDLLGRCQSELMANGRVTCVPDAEIVSAHPQENPPNPLNASQGEKRPRRAFVAISALALTVAFIGALATFFLTVQPKIAFQHQLPVEIQSLDSVSGTPAEINPISQAGDSSVMPVNPSLSTEPAIEGEVASGDIANRILNNAETVIPADSTPPVSTWPDDAPQLALSPFTLKQAEEHQQAWANYLKVPVEYINLSGMKFRLIPPGEFLMGSPEEEIFAALRIPHGEHLTNIDFIQSEGPQRRVTLTQPIYLSTTEITHEQYKNVIGKDLADSNRTPEPSPKSEEEQSREIAIHPVANVRWFDAIEFCNKLSQLEGATPAYSRFGAVLDLNELPGYRLPSEAEWEFACRAGTTTTFFTDASSVELSRGAWTKSNANSSTQPVAKLAPNSFGLFDMSGNVAEWVQDHWDASHYQKNIDKPWIDPKGPTDETGYRVVRGGTFQDVEMFCRSGSRLGIDPGISSSEIGFRIVLPIRNVQQQLEHSLDFNQSLIAGDVDFAAQRRLAEESLKFQSAFIELTTPTGLPLGTFRHGESLPNQDFVVSGASFRQVGHLTDDAMSFLALGSRLRWVDLNSNENLTHVGLTHLKDSRVLEDLDLTSINVSDGIADLINAWPLLKRLTINPNANQKSIFQDADVLKVSPKSYLKHLDIRDTAVTKIGLQGIAVRCPNLESINIAGDGIAAASLRSVENLSEFKHLHSVAISGSQLTASGLAVLKTLPRIRLLEIETPITDQMLRDLGASGLRVDELKIRSMHPAEPAKFRFLPALAGMDFQHLGLTVSEFNGSEGAPTDEELIGLANRKNLRSLSLNFVATGAQQHSDNVGRYTPGGIAALRRLRPDLRLSIDNRDYPPVRLYPKGVNSLAVADWKLPQDAPRPAITPFPPEDAVGYQQAWADYVKQPVEVENSIGMKFRMLPAGEFQTYLWGQNQHQPTDGHAVRLRLSQPYYLGTTEVTVAAFRQFVEETGYVTSMESKTGWAAVTDENGSLDYSQKESWKEPGRFRTRDQDPVTMVTHTDATAFCEWLSKKENVTYRLPTEAEWMQASHAGGEYLFGFVERAEELEPYEWDRSSIQFPSTEGSSPLHLVGTKKPNPFGLYDMLGNVREFARCRMAVDLNTISPIDPVGNLQPLVATCGGAWKWDFSGFHASARGWSDLGTQDTAAYQGFRVLREISGAKPLPAWFADGSVTQSAAAIGADSMVPQPTQIAGLKSWSIETRFHRGKDVHDIQWSSQGDRIATISELDLNIRIWKADGTLERILSGAHGELMKIAFSPDGKFLASSSVRRGVTTPVDELLIWDVETGRLKARLPAHNWSGALAFSPDGKYLAFAFQWQAHTRGACVLNLESGQCSYYPGTKGANAISVAWAADSLSIAVGHDWGDLFVWKLNDSRTPLLMKRSPDENSFRHVSVAWSPDQQWLATWLNERTIRILNAVTGDIVRDMEIEDQFHAGQIRWSRDSHRILIREGNKNGWCIIDSANGAVLHQAETPMYSSTTNWSPDETLMVCPDQTEGATLRFVDVATGKIVRSGERMGGAYAVMPYSVPPDREFLTLSNGYQLGWFDIQTGELLQDVNLPEMTLGQVNWSPDGQLQAIGYLDQGRHSPLILDRKTGDRRKILKDLSVNSESREIRRSSWAQDSRHLALSMADGAVEIWDTLTGLLVRKFETGSAVGWDIEWSPNGKKLTTLGGDRIVRIWDPWTGSLLSTVPEMDHFHPGAGYQHYSRRLVWTDESRFLWIGGALNSYKYDTLTSSFVDTEPLTNGADIISISLSPDNTRLLANERYYWTMMSDFQEHSIGPAGDLNREYNFWMPDSRRIINVGVERTDLVGYDLESKQRLGVLLPSLNRRNEGRRWLCVGPTGHYRGSKDIDEYIVYIALREDGSQTMYSPSEFAKTFNWTNQPDLASFMKPLE